MGRFTLLWVVLLMMLGGCTSIPSTNNETAIPEPTANPTLVDSPKTITSTEAKRMQPIYASPLTPSDGSRLTNGQADLTNWVPVTLDLAGIPVWVTGTQTSQGSQWVVTHVDGQIQAFEVNGNQQAGFSSRPLATSPETVNPRQPLLVEFSGSSIRLIDPSLPEASPLTHATYLPDSKPVCLYLHQWRSCCRTRYRHH